MIEIASVVGVSVDTLERRFADVIKKGRECGKSSLRRMQWKSAKTGSTTMQIWLGKQMLGQADKSDDPDNGAVFGERVIRMRPVKGGAVKPHPPTSDAPADPG